MVRRETKQRGARMNGGLSTEFEISVMSDMQNQPDCRTRHQAADYADPKDSLDLVALFVDLPAPDRAKVLDFVRTLARNIVASQPNNE